MSTIRDLFDIISDAIEEGRSDGVIVDLIGQVGARLYRLLAAPQKQLRSGGHVTISGFSEGTGVGWSPSSRPRVDRS